jgi:hypothetical protein
MPRSWTFDIHLIASGLILRDLANFPGSLLGKRMSSFSCQKLTLRLYIKRVKKWDRIFMQSVSEVSISGF